MDLKLSGRRCILFARGDVNEGRDQCAEQLEELRAFAVRQGLSVTDEVRLENTSANGPRTAAIFDELAGMREIDPGYDVILVADITRLSRDFDRAWRIQKRFKELGVDIHMLDEELSPVVLEALHRAFGEMCLREHHRLKVSP